MSMCQRKCERCDVAMTVLVESKSDCLAFANLAELLLQDDVADVYYIFRAGGADILTHCSTKYRETDVDAYLF